MVDLSLFSDWKYCNACGFPSDQKPSNNETSTPNNQPSPNKPPAKLMACADCSCVAYHDASCQKSHWRCIHKRECKELASAMLPLKELIRWHKMHKKVKKNNSEANVGQMAMMDAREVISSSIGINEGGERAVVVANGNGGGKRVWCWWEPDNENGITEETLDVSNSMWEKGAQKWDDGEYLIAMEGFQNSLEPYRKAWPYIGKSSGTNEGREDDLNDFFDRSLMLARKLLFCAYCELDASQVDSARQRLVQCLSITMTVFFTTPSRASRECIRHVMNDAWMELMLSMEEVPQHRLIARHVASMAITTKSCGWTDPLQRPGYMARVGLSSIPYTPPEKHPSWCRVLENNWIRILNEYSQLSTNPLNFSNVGSGQRGSGHDDHLVVSGRSWKEYVLFGTGAKENDKDAPFTKQLLRSQVPDAVSLAEQGGGEVIFSRLAPRTHIKAHCGPTNLRWTAHLGLVIPDSGSDCQIRVRDKWYSWSAGKITLFDDSYEHEVRNDTDETRVVLLMRVWHPELLKVQRGFFLSEACARKEEEVEKRFHPPR
mmetsp:Transcript_19050/g.34451  ORF Transcript_19050/g.34451 Transcript_19050/m.34451 type:complete len:544 (+) Transcript_19050:85-1716(+)